MNQPKITLEWVAEQNGENYIQSDNRTHIAQKLADTPLRDLELHLSLVKEGQHTACSMTSLLGAFSGNYYTETGVKASNSVLHFPKASEFKCKSVKIQDMKLPTLYPASVIQRFGLKDSVTFHQKTPVFFNVKTGLFFAVMDERFLKDITATELRYDEVEHVKVFTSKDRTNSFLAITSDTIEGLQKNFKNQFKGGEKTLSSYTLLESNYRRLFLELEDAKRVIVLRYECENQDTIEHNRSSQVSIPNFSDAKSVMNLLMRQKMEMEIFQAAQIDSLFYLMDEYGEINPQAIVTYDEYETDLEKRRNKECSMQSFHHYKGGMTYLVIDYTEEDWMFIKNIQERLHSLCKDLETMFQSTKTEMGLPDKPFSEATMIGASSNLLENK